MKLRKKLLSTALVTLLTFSVSTVTASAITGEVNGVARYIPSGQGLNIPADALMGVTNGNYYVREVKLQVYMPVNYDTSSKRYRMQNIGFALSSGGSTLYSTLNGDAHSVSRHYTSYPIISYNGSTTYAGLSNSYTHPSWAKTPVNGAVIQIAHAGFSPTNFPANSAVSLSTHTPPHIH